MRFVAGPDVSEGEYNVWFLPRYIRTMNTMATQYGSWANVVGWRAYAGYDCWLVKFVDHMPTTWAISTADEWMYEYRW